MRVSIAAKIKDRGHGHYAFLDDVIGGPLIGYYSCFWAAGRSGSRSADVSPPSGTSGSCARRTLPCGVPSPVEGPSVIHDLLEVAVDELTDRGPATGYGRRNRARGSFGARGRFKEGLALVDIGIEVSDGGYGAPELLRLKGELLWSEAGPTSAEATETLYQHALDKARQQGALSWELRAATSLARLLRNQGRVVDALASVQPIYGRFTEGFDTADLVAARKLLDELGEACRV